MADQQELSGFLTNLQLEINVSGIQYTELAFAKLSKGIKDGSISLQSLESKYGNLSNATRVLVRDYKKQEIASSKAFGSIAKGAGIAAVSMGILGSAASELRRSFSSLVFPSSLSGAVRQTIDYEKAVLNSAAAVNRLGIGIKQIESSLLRTSGAVSITRMETMRLFDQFQRSMKFTSLSEFQNILKRVNEMVGANAEEMGEYQSAIARVSQEYPMLGRALANIDKADKGSLQNKINTLYITGKIQQAEYQRLSAYVSGNKQMTEEDVKQQQLYQSHIKSQQDFARQVERVGLAYGKAILPWLTKAADWMEKLLKLTESWGLSTENVADIMVKVGAPLSALTAVGGGTAAYGVGKGIMSLLTKKASPSVAGAAAIAPTVTAGGAGINIAKLAGTALGAQGVAATAATFDKQLLSQTASAAASASKAAQEVSTITKTGLLTKLTSGPKFGFGGAAAGVVGGIALGALSDRLDRIAAAMEASGKDAGFAKGGALAAGVAGTALKFGSMGMMLGPVVGGLSALAGAAFELNKAFGLWGKLFGGDKKRVEEQQSMMDKELRAQKANIEESQKLEDRKRTAALSDESKSPIQIQQEIEAAKGELEKRKQNLVPVLDQKAIDDINKELAGKIKIEVQGGKSSEALDKEIETLKLDISSREDALKAMEGKASSEEINSAKKIISQKQDILNKVEQIRARAKDQNEEYKGISDKLAVIESREKTLMNWKSTQLNLISAINTLYQAQTGYLDNMIAKMSMTGQIDVPKIFSAIEDSVSVMDMQIEAHRRLIAYLQTEQSLTVDQLKSMQGMEEVGEQIAKQHNLQGNDLIQGAQALAVIKTSQGEIAKIEVQRAMEYSKATEAYKDQLDLLRANADQASALVQLADNYAIGVKASAEQRMKVFNAEEAYIQVQRQQLGVAQRALAASVDGTEDNLRLRKQVKELETGILQSQLRQAQVVRSLRDAWVSAVSAMNTGSDSFAEIVMNAEQNTAQVMRLGGAVRSAASGAFAMRDAFGQITESVGFVASEKMNQFGEIASASGRTGYERSYITPTEERLGMGIRSPEFGKKMEMEAMFRGIQKQTRDTVSGGLETLGATGHRMITSAVAEAGGILTRGQALPSEPMRISPEVETTLYPKMAAPTREGVELGSQDELATSIGKSTASELRVGKGDAVPVFVTNFQELQRSLSSKPLLTKDVTPLTQPTSQREAVAHLEATGIPAILPQQGPTEKVVNIDAVIRDDGLTDEMRKYFDSLQKMGLKSVTTSNLEQSVEQVHNAMIQGYQEQLSVVNKSIKEQRKAGYVPVQLLSEQAKLEMKILSAQMSYGDAVVNLRKRVQNEFQQDPLLIFYPEFTRRIDRIANEVGLPSKEVLTYYQGFTERVDRLAKEIGIPSAKIYTFYSGFTKEVNRVAINEGLPPEFVIASYSGFAEEINRKAREKGIPSSTIITSYKGFTDSIDRLAKEQGIDRSDLLVKYSGITSALEREVTETGLTTDELMLVYTGQMAKEEVVRKVRERKRIPPEVTVDYEGVVNRVTSTLQHIGLPPEQVSVYYKNIKESITRYAKNIGIPEDEFLVEYQGIINRIEMWAKTVNLPVGEFLLKYEGYADEFTAMVQEQNIPPEVIPMLLKGYHTEFERGIKEVGLPTKDLIIKYPLLANYIERMAIEQGKPSSFFWVKYGAVRDEFERQAKMLNIPSPEYIVRYLNSIDEFERVAVHAGFPSSELLIKYPKVVDEITKVARQYGMPTGEFIVKYVGITEELERAAKETGLKFEDLPVMYSGFSDSMTRAISEQGIPRTALPVFHDGFSTLVRRGIVEKNINKEDLTVEYEAFKEQVLRGVDEKIPESKLKVVFEAFTKEIQRGISERDQKGKPLSELTNEELKIYYEVATNILKRGIIEYGKPVDPLLVYYTKVRDEMERKVMQFGIPKEDVSVFLKGFTNFVERGVTEFGLPTENVVATYNGFTDRIERVAKNYNLPPKTLPVTYVGVTSEITRVASETDLPKKFIEVKYSGFTKELERYASELGINSENLPVFYSGFTNLIERSINEEGLPTRPLSVFYEEIEKLKERGIIEQNVPDDNLIVVYENLTRFLRRGVDETNLDTSDLKVLFEGFTNVVYRGTSEYNLPIHDLLVHYADVSKEFFLMAKEYNLPPDTFAVHYESVMKEAKIAADQIGIPPEKIMVYYEEVEKEFHLQAEKFGVPPSSFMVQYYGYQTEMERQVTELNLPKDKLPVFYANATRVLYRGINEKGITKDDLPVIYEGLTSVLERGITQTSRGASLESDLEIQYQGFKDIVQGKLKQQIPDEDLRMYYKDWVKEVTLGVDTLNVPDENLKLFFENYKNVMAMSISEENKPSDNFIMKYPEVRQIFMMKAKQFDIPPDKFDVFYKGYLNMVTMYANNLNLPDKDFTVRYANTINSMTRTIKAFGVPEDKIPLFLKGVKEYYEATVLPPEIPTVGTLLTGVPKQVKLPIDKPSPLDPIEVYWPEIQKVVKLTAEHTKMPETAIALNFEQVYDIVESTSSELDISVKDMVGQVSLFNQRINTAIDESITSLKGREGFEIRAPDELKTVISGVGNSFLKSVASSLEDMPEVPVAAVYRELSKSINDIIVQQGKKKLDPKHFVVDTQSIEIKADDINPEDLPKVQLFVAQKAKELRQEIRYKLETPDEVTVFLEGIKQFLTIPTEMAKGRGGVPDKIIVKYSDVANEIYRKVVELNLPAETVSLTLGGIQDIYEIMGDVKLPVSVGLAIRGLKEIYDVQAEVDLSDIKTVVYKYPELQETVEIKAKTIGVEEGVLLADFTQFYGSIQSLVRDKDVSVEEFMNGYSKFISGVNKTVARAGVKSDQYAEFQRYYTESSDALYNQIQEAMNNKVLSADQAVKALDIFKEGARIKIKQYGGIPTANLEVENMPEEIKARVEKLGVIKPLKLTLGRVLTTADQEVIQNLDGIDPLIITNDAVIDEVKRRVITENEPSKNLYLRYPEIDDKLKLIFQGFDIDQAKYDSFISAFNEFLSFKPKADISLMGVFDAESSKLREYSKQIGKTPEELETLFKIITGKLTPSPDFMTAATDIAQFSDELKSATAWVALAQEEFDNAVQTGRSAVREQENLNMAQQNLSRAQGSLSASTKMQSNAIDRMANESRISGLIKEKTEKVSMLDKEIEKTSPIKTSVASDIESMIKSRLAGKDLTAYGAKGTMYDVGSKIGASYDETERIITNLLDSISAYDSDRIDKDQLKISWQNAMNEIQNIEIPEAKKIGEQIKNLFPDEGGFWSDLFRNFPYGGGIPKEPIAALSAYQKSLPESKAQYTTAIPAVVTAASQEFERSKKAEESRSLKKEIEGLEVEMTTDTKSPEYRKQRDLAKKTYIQGQRKLKQDKNIFQVDSALVTAMTELSDRESYLDKRIETVQGKMEYAKKEYSPLAEKDARETEIGRSLSDYIDSLTSTMDNLQSQKRDLGIKRENIIESAIKLGVSSEERKAFFSKTLNQIDKEAEELDKAISKQKNVVGTAKFNESFDRDKYLNRPFQLSGRRREEQETGLKKEFVESRRTSTRAENELARLQQQRKHLAEQRSSVITTQKRIESGDLLAQRMQDVVIATRGIEKAQSELIVDYFSSEADKQAVNSLEGQKNILRNIQKVLQLSAQYGVGSSQSLESIAQDTVLMQERIALTNKELAAAKSSKSPWRKENMIDLTKQLEGQKLVLDDLQRRGAQVGVGVMFDMIDSISNSAVDFAKNLFAPDRADKIIDADIKQRLGISKAKVDLTKKDLDASMETYNQLKSYKDQLRSVGMEGEFSPEQQVALTQAEADVKEKKKAYGEAGSEYKGTRRVYKEYQTYMKESGKYGMYQMEEHMKTSPAEKKEQDRERMYRKIGNVEEANAIRNERRQKTLEKKELSDLSKKMGMTGPKELGMNLGRAGMTVEDLKKGGKFLSPEDIQKKIAAGLESRTGRFGGGERKQLGEVGAPVTPETARKMIGQDQLLATQAATGLAGGGGPKVPEGKIPMVAAPETSNIFSVTLPSLAQMNIRFENASQFAEDVAAKLKGQITGGTTAKIGDRISNGVPFGA